MDQPTASLFDAADAGHAEGIARALAMGADPNARDRDGLTALMCVCSMATQGGAELAPNWALSARILAQASDLSLPLPGSPSKGPSQLVGHRAGWGRFGFGAAQAPASILAAPILAQRQPGPALLEFLTILLDAGAGEKEPPNPAISGLMAAAIQAYPDCAELLGPARSASPLSRDDFGHTPLMIAAKTGDAKTIEALLPFDDPRATDEFGRTAMDFLASSRAGADPELSHAIQAAMAAMERAELQGAMPAAEAPAPRNARSL